MCDHNVAPQNSPMCESTSCDVTTSDFNSYETHLSIAVSKKTAKFKMSGNSTCKDDDACSPEETNRLCYADIDSFDVNSLDENGCACNTFYGWTGQNCDELSLSSYITIVLMVLALIAGIFVMLRSISLLYMLLSHSSSRREESCFRKLKPRIVTNIYTLLASFGLILWTVSIVSSVVTTSGPFLASWWAPLDPYKGRTTVIALLGGPVAIFFTMLSMCNVAIMWLDIAYKTINFNPHYTKMYNKNRVFLYGLQVFSLVCAGTVYGFEKLLDNGSSIDGLVFPVVVIILLVWYGFAYKKMTEVLGESLLGTNSEKFTTILKDIRRTTQYIFLVLLLFIVAALVYSVLDTFVESWKAFSNVGKFGLAKAAHHLQVICTACGLAIINKYLVNWQRQSSGHSSTMGIIWRKQSRSTDARVATSLQTRGQPSASLNGHPVSNETGVNQPSI